VINLHLSKAISFSAGTSGLSLMFVCRTTGWYNDWWREQSRSRRLVLPPGWCIVVAGTVGLKHYTITRNKQPHDTTLVPLPPDSNLTLLEHEFKYHVIVVLRNVFFTADRFHRFQESVRTGGYLQQVWRISRTLSRFATSQNLHHFIPIIGVA